MAPSDDFHISTVLCGKRIKSPFGYASVNQEKLYFPIGPLEEYVDFNVAMAEAGAGFITMPSATTLVPEKDAIKTIAGAAPSRAEGRDGRWSRHSTEGLYFTCFP